ncbi:hypothetical protein BKA70DRAFT_50081 [Coprinopsis sp. MPI-PUGE-AT-0042]|nr:hypothetical protein BKA70DRAFT_50081 [Coprinopsis sp. MPI-PUGE-AT-0042]
MRIRQRYSRTFHYPKPSWRTPRMATPYMTSVRQRRALPSTMAVGLLLIANILMMKRRELTHLTTRTFILRITTLTVLCKTMDTLSSHRPNLPSKSPQEYYPRHEYHDGHGRQSNNGFYPSPQAPPVKSRNPYKRAETMPPAHASIPRQPPRQRVTVEFTEDWVAGFSSPTDRHMQARARGWSMPQPEHFEHEKGPADMHWRAQSPNTSEETGSSSGSPPLPVCWGRPLPSSSYATTHSRYTSMPEEPEDYLRVGKL